MKTWNGIAVVGVGRFGDAPTPGVYWLLRICPHGRDEVYRLSPVVGGGRPRTNRGVVRTQGWLGDTDNVGVYAEGALEVFRDRAGRIRARVATEAQIDAAEAVDALEVTT